MVKDRAGSHRLSSDLQAHLYIPTFKEIILVGAGINTLCCMLRYLHRSGMIYVAMQGFCCVLILVECGIVGSFYGFDSHSSYVDLYFYL